MAKNGYLARRKVRDGVLQDATRQTYQQYMTDAWHEKMHQIENCVHCGACKSRCPYGLDTPNLLVEMLKDYDRFYAEHRDDA